MFEIFCQPSVSQALPNKQTPGNTIRQSAFLTVDVVDSWLMFVVDVFKVNVS